VSSQRATKERLTPDRVKRLNSIGFSWDPFTEQWEENFAALQKFLKREGHCRVGQRHQEGGLKLGVWAHNLRSIKDRLTPDQVKRLNSLGFIWDPSTEQWEQAFAALQMFHKREGHCRIKRRHQEGRVKLGEWIIGQRSIKDRLAPDRVKRLNSIGFCWDPIAEQWEQNFAALQKFRKREDHCRVNITHKADGLNLGIWVSSQRLRKDRLTPDRVKRLNSIGFCWDPFTEQWEQNFSALQKFNKLNGHCRVKIDCNLDEVNLGTWVSSQRFKKDILTPERIKRLNLLGFCWDPSAEQWEQNFAALQKFRKCEGHCRVEKRYQEDGLKLGQWVISQRARKDRLTPDQLKRLNSLGFCWDPFTEQWEQNFSALQKFRKREGHCRVVSGYKEYGLKLGQWVSFLRSTKDMLSPDRIERLNSLGFCWDPNAEKWEKNFSALQNFREQEGHCLAKEGCIVDGLNVGQWIQVQRSIKERLTPDRLKRLNSLGFIWDPSTEQWEQNFAALKKFRKREGHCRVAQKHQEDGLKLGQWVSNLRSTKDRLTLDRLKRLNSLGFVWRK
jgi:DNA-binding TFAR19-related protein (PDSD5 family)